LNRHGEVTQPHYRPRSNTARAGKVAHDPEKWEPVSRLREARFGGRRKVGKDHARLKRARAPMQKIFGCGLFFLIIINFERAKI
jgi:hypothetical protein